MDQRAAKRIACSWASEAIRRGLDAWDMESEYDDADGARIRLALEDLMIELTCRGKRAKDGC